MLINASFVDRCVRVCEEIQGVSAIDFVTEEVNSRSLLL